MRLGAALLVAVCCAAFASPVSADVRVTFANGRVTIIASDATVSEILAEWSRVGGSTFVDADKIPSRERVTLHLEDRTELDAIDVLLRRVAGYMVAPVSGPSSGPSVVERVFILPTSTPVAYVPTPEPAATADAFAFPTAAGSPQPDDDGPVRISNPPAPQNAAPQAPAGAAPLGQASPLGATTTQTMPGLGVQTSSQPGATIPSTQPVRRRPMTTPTRPGGGGGR